MPELFENAVRFAMAFPLLVVVFIPVGAAVVGGYIVVSEWWNGTTYY